MNKKLRKTVSAFMMASALTLGSVSMVHAASFGTNLNGASTKEVLQIRYDGAAWNYKGSGYRNASFKYTRNGRTLLTRVTTNGKVTGSVWDDLRWGDKYTTKFSWNHKK